MDKLFKFEYMFMKKPPTVGGEIGGKEAKMDTILTIAYGKKISGLLEEIFKPSLVKITPFVLGKDFVRDLLKISLPMIGEDEVIRIIKGGIRQQGRQIWELYFKNTVAAEQYLIYADHVIYPAALAYALAEGEFSREEIRKIRFDHGDTPQSYVFKNYDWEYPWKILEAILNWVPPPPPMETGEDCHCC